MICFERNMEIEKANGIKDLNGEEEVANLLGELHAGRTETIILEPQDDFNSAIIGYHASSNRLVYDGHALVGIYGKRDGMEYHDALEFIDFNICFGPLTPIVCFGWEEIEERG